MSNIDQPNIILILADDLGYGDLTCYNKNSGKTACLAGVGENGV